MYAPQLLYPLICRWTSRLLPCPGYCKQYCEAVSLEKIHTCGTHITLLAPILWGEGIIIPLHLKDFFKLKDSWFTTLCQFLLYSQVIELYIYMHTFFSFSSIIVYCKILNIIPCATQKDLVCLSISLILFLFCLELYLLVVLTIPF